MRALNARVGVGVVSANRTTFHRLASLKAAHVVALNAVRPVRVLVFIIAAALARVVHTVGRSISLVRVL
jgi:hypothetical protein